MQRVLGELSINSSPLLKNDFIIWLYKYCYLPVGRTAHFLIRACNSWIFSYLSLQFPVKQFSSIITWVHFSPTPFIEVMSRICNTVKFFVTVYLPSWFTSCFTSWLVYIFYNTEVLNFCKISLFSPLWLLNLISCLLRVYLPQRFCFCFLFLHTFVILFVNIGDFLIPLINFIFIGTYES